MKITYSSNGNYNRILQFLDKCSKSQNMEKMDTVGQATVSALASASPVNTGEFASGWTYECLKEDGVPTVNIYNSSHKEVSNLAKMLEYGYANKTSYVQGKHFIKKTMNSIDRQVSKEMEGVVLNVEQTY